MKCKLLILLLITGFLVASCGSKKRTVSGENNDRNSGSNRDLPVRSYAGIVDDYIAGYAEIAKEEMRLYKIPASITLAQGILESGAGRGELTRRANNHFGIKCHEWKGDMVYHDDDRSQECFRKYNDPKYSYRDHSLFLTERARYANLFKLKEDDYKGWAKGLKSAGYATDKLYPRKLIDLIERYELYNYDAEVLTGVKTSPRIARISQNRHTVRQGDTLYSIAKKYNTTVELLQAYNNLNSSDIAVGQELHLEPVQN